MSLASDINADLDNMLGDWGDTITYKGDVFDGVYESEFVETEQMQGFKPVFTAKTADVSAVSRGDEVKVTSVIGDITNKDFKVADLQDQRDGTTKLLLTES